MNQDKNPLVSIIVITYNSAKFVLETLESAKAQTYQNIELIISDDCSSDNTIEICREWLKDNKDRFVNTELIIVEKNTGIPANCNRGVKVSKGDWIKLIAGDDVLIEDSIDKNLSYVRENKNTKILVSSLAIYKDTFSEENLINYSPSENEKCFFSLNPVQQYNLLLRNNKVSLAPTLFISKSVYTIVQYDEMFKYLEDYPFWLNVTNNGFKIDFFSQVTVKYRQSIYSIDNYPSFKIVKPNYFKNEEFRKVYIYPNLPILESLRDRLNYIVFFLLNKLDLLNKNKFNLFFVFLFTQLLNPFSLLVFFRNRFLK